MTEHKTEPAKRLALRVIVILLVIINILQALFLINSQKEAAPGRIIYLRENRVDRESATELVLVDGEGNREQRLGSFTSSPAWSHDGSYIAVGCADPSKICILDTRTMRTRITYPTGNKVEVPIMTAELDIPQPCAEIDARVVSLSWSPTNQELALVCLNIDTKKEQEVCVLSLKNENSCWDHAASTGVRHVDWSPTDANQLLISTGSRDVPEIYLTDRNGKNRAFVDNGWSPAWSSDGRRVAFFRWKDGVNNPNVDGWPGGIAAIRSDGTGLTWLFQPWTISDDPIDYIYYSGSCPECKLNWSPDGRYIVFSGYYVGMYDSYIFRLDINSGEIILLSNPANRYRHNSAPNWGP